ncbi:rhodanese-like domain-containing protein [bacterium]|nr:rhodanese-like domain-containing protein [bacterium]
MFPLESLGKFTLYLLSLFIGMGFGAVLEMSGFGDSRKLAGQFYLRDMTVVKVMFTGIIVAMTLIFFSSSVGLLDFDKVWVNPTFLLSVAVGGFIMGIGFIIGGFCPGTSIVAASTFKLDGIFFVLGVLFGVTVYGETYPLFQNFVEDGEIKRFLLTDLFSVSTGTIMLLVFLLAFIMFYFAEIAESYFGKKTPWSEISLIPKNKRKIAAASVLITIAFIMFFVGDLTPQQKWNRLSINEQKQLDERAVFVQADELRELMFKDIAFLKIIDLRDESDYNLFHIKNSKRVPLKQLSEKESILELQQIPQPAVIFLVSNGEKLSSEGYKILKSNGVTNLYILDGGINSWLSRYPIEGVNPIQSDNKEQLNYKFNVAIGSKYPSSFPNVEHFPAIEFTKKVKLKSKKLTSGGCG